METSRHSREPGAAALAFRSADLGAERELTLPSGPLRYFERGTGPALVFAHGWLANANLWRKVVPRLADRFRCLVLDLPLGAHRTPQSEASDLTPAGIARMLCGVVDRLELDAVTLVGNDSGGAYAQLATADRPERVARLVLCGSETPHDPWPHPAFAPLQAAAASPERLRAFLAPLADPARRARPEAYGLLAKHGIPKDVSDSYVLPLLSDEGIRRDFGKVAPSVCQAAVQRAAAQLIAHWPGTAFFFWAAEDRFFPRENVERYAAELPRAQVTLVDDAYTMTPEDQPERLADLIARAASIEHACRRKC